MSVTSRSGEMHWHAARGGEALRKAGGTGVQLAAISRVESSSEGFPSSDDDEDENVSRAAAIILVITHAGREGRKRGGGRC